MWSSRIPLSKTLTCKSSQLYLHTAESFLIGRIRVKIDEVMSEWSANGVSF